MTRIERLRVGPIGENAYAIESGGIGVLVDPGDNPRAILSFLNEKGIQVSIIALTHGHLDHMAALPDLLGMWEGTRPKIAVHPLDARYLGAAGEAAGQELFEAIHAMGFFRSYWKPMPEPDILLQDGLFIPGTNLKILHTPGHSEGSVCFHEADGNFLVSGDTLFRDGFGRTDGPDSDFGKLRASLELLSGLPPETVVYPGHGPRTTIGRELPNIARNF